MIVGVVFDGGWSSDGITASAVVVGVAALAGALFGLGPYLLLTDADGMVVELRLPPEADGRGQPPPPPAPETVGPWRGRQAPVEYVADPGPDDPRPALVHLHARRRYGRGRAAVRLAGGGCPPTVVLIAFTVRIYWIDRRSIELSVGDRTQSDDVGDAVLLYDLRSVRVRRTMRPGSCCGWPTARVGGSGCRWGCSRRAPAAGRWCTSASPTPRRAALTSTYARGSCCACRDLSRCAGPGTDRVPPDPDRRPGSAPTPTATG